MRSNWSAPNVLTCVILFTVGFGVSIAHAEVFEIACNWSGQGGLNTVPELWLVDTSANTVTNEGFYQNSAMTAADRYLGTAYQAQVTQGFIDWNDGGRSFHLNRFSGILTFLNIPNTDTMDCQKVAAQPLPTPKF